MKALLAGSGMAALAVVVMFQAPTASAASADGVINDLPPSEDHGNSSRGPYLELLSNADSLEAAPCLSL